jgi:hypothetical protein
VYWVLVKVRREVLKKEKDKLAVPAIVVDEILDSASLSVIETRVFGTLQHPPTPSPLFFATLRSPFPFIYPRLAGLRLVAFRFPAPPHTQANPQSRT